MNSQVQERTARESDVDADSVYLDIRLRILHGQFLPDQIIERASVVTHFHTSRSVADRALEDLSAEGYLRQTLRGGYAVRRYSEHEVAATLALGRKIAGVGVRSLTSDPDPFIINRLGEALKWDAHFDELGPAEIEDFTQRTRSINNLLMRRAEIAGVIQPLKLLASPALHRHAVHCMTNNDVEEGWDTVASIGAGVLEGDAIAAVQPLSKVPRYEQSLVETIAKLNELPAAPTVSFAVPVPEFHCVFGDESDRPYFGLGRREVR